MNRVTLNQAAFRSVLGISALLFAPLVLAQSPTQVLIAADSKSNAALTPAELTVDVNGHATPITAVTPLTPDTTQVALLIDDGLRTSIGRQLEDIQQFIQSLPSGVEVMVGYMQNGDVTSRQGFTTNHAAAAAALRLPFSTPGLSASPYLCLSEFSKHWPRETEAYGTPAQAPVRKQRIVLMLTNGVDPYNGSVSPLNQNSHMSTRRPGTRNAPALRFTRSITAIPAFEAARPTSAGRTTFCRLPKQPAARRSTTCAGNPVALAPYLTQVPSGDAAKLCGQLRGATGQGYGSHCASGRTSMD